MTTTQRIAAGVALLAVAAGVHTAVAAALPVPARTLAAGTVAPNACGSLSGTATAWTLTSGNVTAVTVSGLPSTCNGAVASLTLANTGSASIAAGSNVTVASGSAVFGSLSANPPYGSVAAVHLSLVGP